MTTAVLTSQPSRVGETLERLHVGSEFGDPLQRWVISRRPGINPAFAIAEGLWILCGRNDASVMNCWFRDLPKFAGNGQTYAGAYGYRLRKHFGVDQVKQVCEALCSIPETRQVVLQFLDVLTDLQHADGAPRSADVPCDVISMLKVRDGRLEWTQVLRIDDVYRGLPNNFVKFTLLQEAIAGWLGLKVDGYHQWRDSLHIYKESLKEFSCGDRVAEETNTDSLALHIGWDDQLTSEIHRRMTVLTAQKLNDKPVSEIAAMDDAPVGYRNLLRVLAAESARRRGRLDQAQALIVDCTNSQFAKVCSTWLERFQVVPATHELLSF